MKTKVFLSLCCLAGYRHESHGDEYYSYCLECGRECSLEEVVEENVAARRNAPTAADLLAYLQGNRGDESERTVDAIVGVGDAPEHE